MIVHQSEDVEDRLIDLAHPLYKTILLRIGLDGISPFLSKLEKPG